MVVVIMTTTLIIAIIMMMIIMMMMIKIKIIKCHEVVLGTGLSSKPGVVSSNGCITLRSAMHTLLAVVTLRRMC